MNVARFALGMEVYAQPEIIGVEDIFQCIPPSCRRHTRIPNSGTHHIFFTHLSCLTFQSVAKLEYRAPRQNSHIFGTHVGYCYVYGLRNVCSAASLLRAKNTVLPKNTVYFQNASQPNICPQKSWDRGGSRGLRRRFIGSYSVAKKYSVFPEFKHTPKSSLLSKCSEPLGDMLEVMASPKNTLYVPECFATATATPTPTPTYSLSSHKVTEILHI